MPDELESYEIDVVDVNGAPSTIDEDGAYDGE